MDAKNENPTPPLGGGVTPPGAGGTGPEEWAPASSSADPGRPVSAPPPDEGSAVWQWAPPVAPRDAGTPQQPSRSRFVLVLTVVVALLAGMLGAGLDALLRSNSGSSPNTGVTSGTGLAGGKGAVAGVAAAVDPAVVDIRTDVANQLAVGAERAAGTGMLVTPTGEVLTNNHVVDEATRILVTVFGHGTYPVKVVGVDATQDIALLQLVGAPRNLPYVRLGNSAAVQVGAPVVAIGNALGLGGKPTVISGTITAVGRTINAEDSLGTTSSETLHNLLQTDAQIVPGDSGGPLVNLKGQVIGMDTAAQSSEASGYAEGYAIPINHARSIARLIAQGRSSSQIHLGESAFLGVLIGGVYPGAINPFGLPTSTTTPVSGVQISAVDAATPAQRAGLQAGDTITAIDGRATPSNQVLLGAIQAHKPGAPVSVTYVDTSGTTHTVRVDLAGIAR
jgi:S1-C subfamily serine protease